MALSQGFGTCSSCNQEVGIPRGASATAEIFKRKGLQATAEGRQISGVALNSALRFDIKTAQGFENFNEDIIVEPNQFKRQVAQGEAQLISIDPLFAWKLFFSKMIQTGGFCSIEVSYGGFDRGTFSEAWYASTQKNDTRFGFPPSFMLYKNQTDESSIAHVNDLCERDIQGTKIYFYAVPYASSVKNLRARFEQQPPQVSLINRQVRTRPQMTVPLTSPISPSDDIVLDNLTSQNLDRIDINDFVLNLTRAAQVPMETIEQRRRPVPPEDDGIRDPLGLAETTLDESVIIGRPGRRRPRANSAPLNSIPEEPPFVPRPNSLPLDFKDVPNLLHHQRVARFVDLPDDERELVADELDAIGRGLSLTFLYPVRVHRGEPWHQNNCLIDSILQLLGFATIFNGDRAQECRIIKNALLRLDLCNNIDDSLEFTQQIVHTILKTHFIRYKYAQRDTQHVLLMPGKFTFFAYNKAGSAAAQAGNGPIHGYIVHHDMHFDYLMGMKPDEELILGTNCQLVPYIEQSAVRPANPIIKLPAPPPRKLLPGGGENPAYGIYLAWGLYDFTTPTEDVWYSIVLGRISTIYLRPTPVPLPYYIDWRGAYPNYQEYLPYDEAQYQQMLIARNTLLPQPTRLQNCLSAILACCSFGSRIQPVSVSYTNPAFIDPNTTNETTPLLSVNSRSDILSNDTYVTVPAQNDKIPGTPFTYDGNQKIYVFEPDTTHLRSYQQNIIWLNDYIKYMAAQAGRRVITSYKMMCAPINTILHTCYLSLSPEAQKYLLVTNALKFTLGMTENQFTQQLNEMQRDTFDPRGFSLRMNKHSALSAEFERFKNTTDTYYKRIMIVPLHYQYDNQSEAHFGFLIAFRSASNANDLTVYFRLSNVSPMNMDPLSKAVSKLGWGLSASGQSLDTNPKGLPDEIEVISFGFREDASIFSQAVVTREIMQIMMAPEAYCESHGGQPAGAALWKFGSGDEQKKCDDNALLLGLMHHQLVKLSEMTTTPSIYNHGSVLSQFHPRVHGQMRIAEFKEEIKKVMDIAAYHKFHDNKKSYILIGVIILVLVAIALLCFFLIPRREERAVVNPIPIPTPSPTPNPSPSSRPMPSSSAIQSSSSRQPQSSMNPAPSVTATFSSSSRPPQSSSANPRSSSTPRQSSGYPSSSVNPGSSSATPRQTSSYAPYSSVNPGSSSATPRQTSSYAPYSSVNPGSSSATPRQTSSYAPYSSVNPGSSSATPRQTSSYAPYSSRNPGSSGRPASSSVVPRSSNMPQPSPTPGPPTTPRTTTTTVTEATFAPTFAPPTPPR